MRVRRYRAGDYPEWRRMRTAFWPDQTTDDMEAWLSRSDATIIVAERERGGLCGFAEVGARPYADGCLTSPVAYLEGWWVDPDTRRSGIGTALARAVEDWAREHGYRELASDAAIDNDISQQAHRTLGFAEVGHVVQYRKEL